MFNLDYFFSLAVLLCMLNHIENPDVSIVRLQTSCPKESN